MNDMSMGFLRTIGYNRIPWDFIGLCRISLDSIGVPYGSRGFHMVINTQINMHGYTYITVMSMYVYPCARDTLHMIAQEGLKHKCLWLGPAVI